MEITRLILDYLKVLIWPTTVVTAIFLFRRHINSVLSRLATRSKELTATFPGLELSAKFSEEVAELAERSDSLDPDELRASVKRTARDFALEEFRGLSAHFFGSSHPVRLLIAEQVAQVATRVSLEDLLELGRSINAGQRVGAAIGLRVHMEDSTQARTDPKVLSTLKMLLKDEFSRVRYRALQAARTTPGSLYDEIERLAKSDPNPVVADLANEIIVDT